MHTKKTKVLSIYDDVRWLTISNVLTASRIVLAPCVVVAIYLQLWTLAFVLFFYAGATDFFDGFIARLCKDQTHLGSVLDPIADKLFLTTSFGALALLPSPLFPIPEWFFGLVVMRECIILVGSYIIMKVNKAFVVAPTMWGKVTTCFQLLFILWLFICYFAHWSPIKTYKVSLIVLSMVSIASLIQYMHKGLAYWQQAARK